MSEQRKHDNQPGGVPPRALCRVAAGAVAAALAGCGAAQATPTCRPLPTPAPPHVSSGVLTAVASAGSVPPGGDITFTETVNGPATYMADCTTPLQVSITDATDLSVDSPASSAQQSGRCGTVTLHAGQTASYTVDWAPDPTLPSGTYTVALTLGDQATVRLAVPVRTAEGGCG